MRFPAGTQHVVYTVDYEDWEILGVYGAYETAKKNARQSKDPYGTYIQSWKGSELIETWGPAKEFKRTKTMGTRSIGMASA